MIITLHLFIALCSNGDTEASESINGAVSAFSALKRGRLKTYKGYIWKFKN